MKLLLFMTLIVVGCSEPSIVEDKTALYREAILRTRDTYHLDTNVDGGNEATLAFATDFSGQLVEVNFSTKPMNSAFYTLVNTDAKKHTIDEVRFSELKIAFNGADITECLVAECNATKCHGLDTPRENFSGDLSTHNLSLNLSKLALSCSGLSFSPEGQLNQLTFSESSETGLSTSRGGRLVAQVVVYKRAYRPQDMPINGAL